jgi:hypothetical protein
MAYTKMIAVTPETHTALKQFAENMHWDIGYAVEWLYNFYARQPKLDTPISNLDEQKDEVES